MGGITFADLVNYNGEAESSAAGWASLLAGVEESASYFESNAIAPTGQVWKGTAAQLAASSFQKTKGGLIENAASYSKIRAALKTLDSQLVELKGQLIKLADSITRGETFNGVAIPDGYFEVTADGSVQRFAGTNHLKDNPQLDAIIPQLQQALDGLVAQANTDDGNAAKVLAQYFPKAEFAKQAPTTAAWKTVSSYGSLWQIAQTEYGDGNMWTKVWDANKATFAAHGVTDPNVIPTGLTLKVPPLTSSTGPAATSGAPTTTGFTGTPAHATTTGSPQTQPGPTSSSPSPGAVPVGPGEI